MCSKTQLLISRWLAVVGAPRLAAPVLNQEITFWITTKHIESKGQNQFYRDKIAFKLLSVTSGFGKFFRVTLFSRSSRNSRFQLRFLGWTGMVSLKKRCRWCAGQALRPFPIRTSSIEDSKSQRWEFQAVWEFFGRDRRNAHPKKFRPKPAKPISARKNWWKSIRLRRCFCGVNNSWIRVNMLSS